MKSRIPLMIVEVRRCSLCFFNDSAAKVWNLSSGDSAIELNTKRSYFRHSGGFWERQNSKLS
jgi:hypothetical protein